MCLAFEHRRHYCDGREQHIYTESVWVNHSLGVIPSCVKLSSLKLVMTHICGKITST